MTLRNRPIHHLPVVLLQAMVWLLVGATGLAWFTRLKSCGHSYILTVEVECQFGVEDTNAMTLRELIEKLSELDRSCSVYVEQGRLLEPSSNVQLVDIPEEANVPPVVPGMRCFMDVWQIRDVLSDKEQLLGMSAPTLDQQVEMLLSFAAQGA